MVEDQTTAYLSGPSAERLLPLGVAALGAFGMPEEQGIDFVMALDENVPLESIPGATGINIVMAKPDTPASPAPNKGPRGPGMS